MFKPVCRVSLHTHNDYFILSDHLLRIAFYGLTHWQPKFSVLIRMLIVLQTQHRMKNPMFCTIRDKNVYKGKSRQTITFCIRPEVQPRGGQCRPSKKYGHPSAHPRYGKLDSKKSKFTSQPSSIKHQLHFMKIRVVTHRL